MLNDVFIVPSQQVKTRPSSPLRYLVKPQAQALKKITYLQSMLILILI